MRHRRRIDLAHIETQLGVAVVADQALQQALQRAGVYPHHELAIARREVEIEPGIDGLLHVSDLSWTKKLTHPNEVLKKGEDVKCVVLEVDQTKQRIALGLKQMHQDPWDEAIPSQYQPGMIVEGKVTKITNFGVFVELEDELEGLLHISELADHKVENPQDIVQVDQQLEVKILRVDLGDRKIGLSLKRAQWTAESDGGEEQDVKKDLGGGMDRHGALGTDKITFGPDGN